MTANKPMTGEQLDELMTVAVNMQRDAEIDCNRPSAMFAYAVQVAVLELRNVRDDAVELEQKLAESQREFRAADATIENMQMQVEKLAAENAGLKTHGEALAVDNAALREVVERMINQFAMSGISPEEKSINPSKSLMFDAKSALFMPAADAFLAEVRAQGVEMFAAVLRRKGDDAFLDAIAEAQANAADLFATQIRKGVQS